MKLILKVMGMELKKIFSYRFAFWIKFFLESFCEIAIAYFLWTSIFAYNGITEIKGFDLPQLITYYVFVSFASRLTAKDMDSISRDIYDGGLTKYLIYPTSFFKFKLMGYITSHFISVLQFFTGIIVFSFALDFPLMNNPQHIMLGLIFSFYVGILNFFMISSLELIAFWQDVVWNLRVMYRFISSILGGLYLPLSFFPSEVREWIHYLPFQYLYSVPVSIFMGTYNVSNWRFDLLLSSAWLIFFMLITRLVWHRGRLQFTGVGI